MAKKHLFFLLVTMISATSFAKDYFITSASQLNALSLNPCDVVTWRNGTYANQSIVFNASGQSGSPIVLRAETPGGVIFTGGSKMNIYGEYLIVDGFYWNGGEGFNNHTEFRRGGSNTDFASHTIFRNCAFNDLQTDGDDKSRWVVLYGRNNTIENCSFLNKRSTGATVLVELAFQTDGKAGHMLRNNFFFNITDKDGRTNNGDSEAIRIGESSFQAVDASVTVEGNYFLQADGENEIITNKSKGNSYLRNTFRRSRGSLVLRHGAGATVQGNYFLGENKAKSGGIRISDQDHVITNNYMQDLNNSSDSFNNGITLMGGDAASGGTSNGYQNVRNVTIAFNTIYNAVDPIYFNDDRGNNVPQGVIANNVIYSTRGTIVSGDVAAIGGQMTYEGNVFGGSTIGSSNGGITNANAEFTASGEIFKPSATGPAANTAVAGYDQLTTDIEGRNRPSSGKDVGAHEVSGGSGTATNFPITDSAVGNGVGACYLDATGAVSASSCPIVDYGSNCAPITVTGVEVHPESATITVGTSTQLTATVAPSDATNKEVAWVSSNPDVATVDNDGVIAGIAIGVAMITATTSDGSFTDDSEIKVVAPLTPPDCVAGTNLSANATIASFSAQQEANPASNVLDGDTSDANRWSAEGYPNNIVIDLGAAYNINEIRLFPYRTRSYQYTLEGSESSATDGFVTLVDRSNNTTAADPIADTFATTVVRYVRLNVTGLVGDSSNFVSIREVEIICAGATASVNDADFGAQVKLYPNPFEDRLNIDIPVERVNEVKEIHLLDITGKIIYRTIEVNVDNEISLPSNTASGVYFMQFVGANNQTLFTKKVLRK